jgi:hypothetical protein
VELSEIIKISILLITAIIALFQLNVMVRSFKADHERRKKQATIEYINMIRPEYRKINNLLLEKFGNDPIGESEIKKIIEDHELWSKLKDILGMFEHLATGINTGVFDIQILNRMAGSYIIIVYDRFFVYIRERRKATGNNFLFDEYEFLINRLKSIRMKRKEKGDIKLS